MVTSRWIAAVVAVASVALGFFPAPVTVASGAAGVSQASASALDFYRAYGDGPAHLESGDRRARVHFRGSAGDEVRLEAACSPLLREDRGDKVARSSGGWWRLPADGFYTFVHRACRTRGGPVDLQLIVREVHRLDVDGAPLVVPERLGFLDLVEVRVPRSGRVQVASSDGPYLINEWERVALPGGVTYTSEDCQEDFYYCEWPDALYLEAGRPFGGPRGPFRIAGDPHFVLHRGDRVLVQPAGAATFRATRARVRSVTIDGKVVDLAKAAPFQEVALELDVTAGQWIHLATSPDTSGNFGVGYNLLFSLVGPHGVQYESAWKNGLDFWQVPTTGRYRILVGGDAVPLDMRVRVRSVRELAEPMPTDGTPVTFTTATPGEWVVATVDQPGSFELHGSSSDAQSGWFGYTERGPRWFCTDYGPLGCMDGKVDYVDAETVASPGFFYPVVDPSVVLMGVAPGKTASVTLSLRPCANLNGCPDG